uniref:Uncharacterized protein n=1 Tax=Romanomermis culicivorax TaxID=13658 RepID=A0A915IFW8_ROMCU
MTSSISSRRNAIQEFFKFSRKRARTRALRPFDVYAAEIGFDGLGGRRTANNVVVESAPLQRNT